MRFISQPSRESSSTVLDRRRIVFGAALVICLSCLAARMVQIQYVGHERLAARALRQHGRYEKLPARSGDLLDVRGRPLAISIESPSIFVDPKAVPPEKRAEVASSLGLVLGIDPAKFLERLENSANRRFLWVKRHVSEHDARGVRDLKWPSQWVGIQSELHRCYPQGAIASHVLGFRDIDGKGRDGIEKSFDKVLAGKPGCRVSARDALGRTLAVHDRLTRAAVPGSTVVLTIDSVIQAFAEEALDSVMETWRPSSATAIVMNPKTGELLGLACRPHANLDYPADTPTDAWVNRAISDSYEPGSTFKPFIVAAALDWGIVGPDQTIDCHDGVYRMGPRVLHSHHRNGVLSVPEIVIRSDNIGMAIIGEKLTNSGLYRAVESFGFGRLTGIELPGESPGCVRPLRQWTPFYSTGSVPMGQEIATTPLQLITAFAALANGGELLRPRIVRAIVGPDGQNVRVFDKPELLARPIRRETAEFMVRSVLTDVVERGTGYRAQLAGYTVFGKTGTAQKQSPNGGYEPGHYISSFVAGAPAPDPQLVAMVVLNDPTNGPEPFGGKVAAPATAEILKQSLVYLGVPHDRELTRSTNRSAPLPVTD